MGAFLGERLRVREVESEGGGVLPRWRATELRVSKRLYDFFTAKGAESAGGYDSSVHLNSDGYKISTTLRLR